MYPERTAEKDTVVRHLPVSAEYLLHIDPSDTVAVMGPGSSVHADPGLLFLSEYMAYGTGRLIVVDPQSSDTKFRMRNTEREPVVGSGNVSRYRQELLQLFQLGMPLKPFEWQGTNGTVFHTGLADAETDVIVDHTTSVFISGPRGYRDIDPAYRTGILRPIFTEYGRTVRPGGTLLLSTNDSAYGLVADPKQRDSRIDLSALLSDAGFTVTKKVVDDVCYVPLPAAVAEYFKLFQPRYDDPQPDTGVAMWDADELILLGNRGMLRLEPPVHVSPDLYIGTRR